MNDKPIILSSWWWWWPRETTRVMQASKMLISNLCRQQQHSRQCDRDRPEASSGSRTACIVRVTRIHHSSSSAALFTSGLSLALLILSTCRSEQAAVSEHAMNATTPVWSVQALHRMTNETIRSVESSIAGLAMVEPTSTSGVWDSSLGSVSPSSLSSLLSSSLIKPLTEWSSTASNKNVETTTSQSALPFSSSISSTRASSLESVSSTSPLPSSSSSQTTSQLPPWTISASNISLLSNKLVVSSTASSIYTIKRTNSPPPPPPPPSSSHSSTNAPAFDKEQVEKKAEHEDVGNDRSTFALHVDVSDCTVHNASLCSPKHTTTSATTNMSEQTDEPSNKCEYGRVWHYQLGSLVDTFLVPNITTTASVYIKCLHPITWGDGKSEAGTMQANDRLNGQKYMVYISDFKTNSLRKSVPAMSEKHLKHSTKPIAPVAQTRAGVFKYFEYLWNDIKSIWPFDETDESHRDDLDQDLLRSMENELQSSCWQNYFQLYDDYHPYSYYNTEVTCKNCLYPPPLNPLYKIMLPFWFVQLEDGSIPEIRFTKLENNLKVKNIKKFIVSLLVTKLNKTQHFKQVEESVYGQRNVEYRFEKETQNISHSWNVRKNILENISDQSSISELTVVEHSFDSYQLQQLNSSHQFVPLSTNGKLGSRFELSDLSQYLTIQNQYSLKDVPVDEQRSAHMLDNLNKRYKDGVIETLVASNLAKEAILERKHVSSYNKVRTKLGRNENTYYNRLFEYATSGPHAPEYNVLFKIVTLERQLNLTWSNRKHAHSLIADIRRIGTLRNIQHICGANLKNLDTSECRGYLTLLLKSGSKIGQQIMFYCFQNERNLLAKRETAVRLLSQTVHPIRWLIENLAHEMRKLAKINKSLEKIVLQTLAILSQNDQLIKLKEMLSMYTANMINETRGELELIDLIDTFGSVDNFTVIESMHQFLQDHQDRARSVPTELLTLSSIQLYRHSLNRFQVQTRLGHIFRSSKTCQVKQEIVQLVIDYVDQFVWEDCPDKRWPKYGFNQLDQIFAKELEHSKDNCVHHLIIDYFKRKVSHTALSFVARFEKAHNFNASAFDFCVREDGLEYKCDYVQRQGTDLVTVTMRKTIKFVTNKEEQEKKEEEEKARNESIYTKYSISVEMLSAHLTVCHLAVIETRNIESKSNELRVKLVTHQGQSIPLARLDVAAMVTAMPHKLVQYQFDTPNIILWQSVDPFVDQSLLVQFNAHLHIELVHSEDAQRKMSSDERVLLHVRLVLDISGESVTSSLTKMNTIDLKNVFDYQSYQPIGYARPIASSSEKNNNSTSSLSPIVPPRQYLGSEKFYNQIELRHDTNKYYDQQCNVWVEEPSPAESSNEPYTLDTAGTGPSMLLHWNSTFEQTNLFALAN